MEINFDSAAFVPIINVPAKKVSPQGTPLTREMIGLPLIRYSMVYTHTSWSLRKSPPPQMLSSKAGESRGRAPGQASDFALRAPNPLDSSTMTRCFIKISGTQTSPGPRYFALPSHQPCSPGHISYKIWPPWLSLAIWPLYSYDT